MCTCVSGCTPVHTCVSRCTPVCTCVSGCTPVCIPVCLDVHQCVSVYLDTLSDTHSDISLSQQASDTSSDQPSKGTTEPSSNTTSLADLHDFNTILSDMWYDYSEPKTPEDEKFERVIDLLECIQRSQQKIFMENQHLVEVLRNDFTAMQEISQALIHTHYHRPLHP